MNIVEIEELKDKPVHIICQSKGYGKTYHEMQKIIKEKEDLQERINKAIKYIEILDYVDYGTGYYDIDLKHYNKLLEILIGGDKVENKKR